MRRRKHGNRELASWNRNRCCLQRLETQRLHHGKRNDASDRSTKKAFNSPSFFLLLLRILRRQQSHMHDQMMVSHRFDILQKRGWIEAFHRRRYRQGYLCDSSSSFEVIARILGHSSCCCCLSCFNAAMAASWLDASATTVRFVQMALCLTVIGSSGWHDMSLLQHPSPDELPARKNLFTKNFLDIARPLRNSLASQRRIFLLLNTETQTILQLRRDSYQYYLVLSNNFSDFPIIFRAVVSAQHVFSF